MDKPLINLTMSTPTMSFALPQTMRAHIDERVKSGCCGNTGENLQDLIRRDREAQAAQQTPPGGGVRPLPH